MINKSAADTNKKLTELNKMMQNMDAQCRKKLEFSKRLQLEIQEIKNSNESIGARSD